MEQALIVIDVQNDFCPGGALAVPGGDEIVPLINTLIEGFDHVVLTQDWHPAGHSSFASSHPGKQPFSTIEMPYGDADAVAGPLHPGHGRGGVSSLASSGPRPSSSCARAFARRSTATRPSSRTTARRRPGSPAISASAASAKVMLVGLATDFCVAYSALDAARRGFETTVVLDCLPRHRPERLARRCGARCAAAGVTLTEVADWCDGWRQWPTPT